MKTKPEEEQKPADLFSISNMADQSTNAQIAESKMKRDIGKPRKKVAHSEDSVRILLDEHVSENINIYHNLMNEKVENISKKKLVGEAILVGIRVYCVSRMLQREGINSLPQTKLDVKIFGEWKSIECPCLEDLQKKEIKEIANNIIELLK